MNIKDISSYDEIKENILPLLQKIHKDINLLIITKSYLTTVKEEMCIIQYQVRNLAVSEAVFYGDKIALDNLYFLNKEQKIHVLEFIDEIYGGKIIIYEKKIIGLILVKKNNKYYTPPNWDGSNEMLEKFNNNH